MNKATNLQHYKAHQLVTEYQRLQMIEDSAERLQQFTKWQSDMERYGKSENLKKAC